MKRPITQLTIRRLMLVVAGLAVIFGFVAWMARMTERSSRFNQLASRHAQEFFRHLGNIESRPVLAAPLEKAGMSPADIDKFLGGIEREERLRDYHAGLKAKYERLAFYPWLTAEPDPPAPE